jgi:transcription antitermination factor NusG
LKRKKLKGAPGRKSEKSTEKKKPTKLGKESHKRFPRKSSRREDPTKVSKSVLTDDNYKIVDPATKWIIVELSEDTSLEQHYEQIAHTLEDVLGPEVASFIPVYHERVQGKNACYVLFDGYVFVRRTDTVVSQIFRLKSEFIKGVLFVDGCMRLVSGARINEYKEKMLVNVKAMVPEEGQRVVPRVGVFKNLEGTVLSVDKKKLIAIVKFEKSSRIVEAPINVVNLSILASDECNTSSSML